MVDIARGGYQERDINDGHSQGCISGEDIRREIFTVNMVRGGYQERDI